MSIIDTAKAWISLYDESPVKMISSELVQMENIWGQMSDMVPTEVFGVVNTSVSEYFCPPGWQVDHFNSIKISLVYIGGFELCSIKDVGCILFNFTVYMGPTMFMDAAKSFAKTPRIVVQLNYLEAIWDEYVNYRRRMGQGNC